jgi:hypothetical protein
LFSYLSAGVGGSFSEPFGVTLSPPFVSEATAISASTSAHPFPLPVTPGASGTISGRIDLLGDVGEIVRPREERREAAGNHRAGSFMRIPHRPF